MTTEDNNQTPAEVTEQKVEQESGDFLQVSKTEWEKTNQTLGSLKRQLKDLQKSNEPKETAEPNQDNALLQRLERIAFKQAGIDHPDDMELARKTAQKWKVDVDEVLADEDFKVKLERQQTVRNTRDATTNIKGDPGTSPSKTDPAIYIARGAPPTSTEVSSRKERAKIVRAMLEHGKSTGTFYNE